MGGLAFTTAPHNLQTPRLPPLIYYRLRHDFQRRLRALYEHVASPVAAPDKESHGDIDLIVAASKDPDGRLKEQCRECGGCATAGHSTETIAAILGAERWIAIKNNPTRSFAVQLAASDALFLSHCQQPRRRRRSSHEDVSPQFRPEPDILGNDVVKHTTAPSSPSPAYVQVDVHILPTIHSLDVSLFQWRIFHHSHGDLWNLLGTTIRPFGLTANEQGFHVRIPEIEFHNRRRSLILLTTDCHAVLSFLGLGTHTPVKSHMAERAINREVRQAHVLEDEFASVEDMYMYICRGRFFRKQTYQGWHLDQGPQRETGSVGVACRSKHNDRKRMGQRDVYRRFVEEWVPALPDDGMTTVEWDCDGSESTQAMARRASCNSIPKPKGDDAAGDSAIGADERAWARVRQDVLDEALDLFCKRAEYDHRLAEWRDERWDLGSKQCSKKRKKAHAGEDEAYGRAWMAWLIRESDT